MRKSNVLSKILSIFVVTSMILSGMSLPWAGGTQEAYAKERGQKNPQACDSCEAVRDNKPPAGYGPVAGTEYQGQEGQENKKYAVYSGGDSYSRSGDGEHDQDKTNFANPLPYGNVYVDANKLNWNNPNGFIIDIQDKEHFKWVSVTDEPLRDAKGNTSTNDPMGVAEAGPLKIKSGGPLQGIFYVGPLQSYLKNMTDPVMAPTEGKTTTNVIEPTGDAEYLYRITYLNAVTLPNGTKGNLVLTMKKVQIETSVTINDEKDDKGKFKNSYKLSYKDAQGETQEYEYTKALIKIQGANQLSNDTGYSITDAKGNPINQQYTLYMTAEEAKKLREKYNYNPETGKGYLPEGQEIADSFVADKSIRNATGNILDLDIEVVDAEGNSVEGTISYAAHDMDFESAQNVWGRPVGDEFSEGVTIVEGSQSYALVPNYNHADKTTRKEGWVPVGPGYDSLDRPLIIERVTEDGSHADGIRFASPFLTYYRNSEGTFEGLPLNNDQIATIQGASISNNDYTIVNEDYSKLPFASGAATTNARKMIFAMMKEAEEDPESSWKNKTPETWDEVTADLSLEFFNNAAWKTYRNDFDNGNNNEPKGASFDSGFAVLLSSEKTSIQWSGSRLTGASINTTLFDPTLFTYIEQTHGTGGGIYMENYNLSQDCAVTPMEGVVTMGRGSDATVTAVAEDGYRIKEFQIGGAELANPVTYTMVYGADGRITGIESGGTTTSLPDGKATIDGIEFEVNDNGSVDVSANITDPRHIHVDFDADYYFYKIWKGGEPTELNMTAVPYAYIFTDVTLPVPTGELDEEGKPIYEDTHFSIDGTDYTAEDGTKYVLNPNNNLETAEQDAQGYPLVVLPYVLKGNSFVGTDHTEYPITVQFGVNFRTEESGKVEFTVKKEGAYADYVTELGTENTISPGNTVWKIKYPASGVDDLDWPALPIETEPAEHNRNHVERNYWFTTEDVSGWSLEGYDNSNAETPGVVSDEYYKDHVWKAASVKDYDAAKEVIHNEFMKKNAFMSVFSLDANNTTKEKSYGGQITNVQPVVVKGVKNWDDQNNLYKNRQEIWLHIDAKVDDKVTKDVLPPQKIAVDTAESHTITWGDKTAYETNQENVKVIHDLADIPLKDESGRRVTYERNDDGSYTATNGITYWLNELVQGKDIVYIVRETLDAKGEKLVKKDDPSTGLIGYTADSDEATCEKINDKTEVDDIEVDTYQGELTNKINFTDFQVTKIWKENGSNHEHSLEADATKLKNAFTLQENGKTWVDSGDTPKLQPSVAEEYNTSSKSGTLEIKNGEDETEVVFIWHNVPIGVPDTDDEGNPIVRKAEFSIVESQLNGYEAPKYSNDEKALDDGTITNEVLPPKGKPKQTWGEKNKPQTANGKSMFKVTTETDIDGNPNEIVLVELIDPNTLKPVKSVKVDGGTYTIDENGVITFMPDEDFVGDPPPVTVRGTDSNGLSAVTTYTPHVVETTKKVTRTIVYEYNDGTPVIDKSTGEPLTVVQVVEFAGTLNPETGDVIYPADAEGTMEEVPSGDISEWNYDKEKVGEVVVYPTSNDMYEKVIYSPKGIKPTADVTYGLPNETQKGEPKFEFDDGTTGNITVKLIDPYSGESVDDDTVDAVDEDGNKVGTYKLNDDGTVTFTPDKDYVGNPMPLELEGSANSKSARTTYTPHIVYPEITDTASRNIYYTYETKDGKEVTGSVTQTVTIRKYPTKVDSKTGEVLEWGDWEPTKFPALENPDDKVDGKIWFTKDSVGEETVTSPGKKEDVHVVYQKIPYTVTYLDGKHGKSDGKGNQSGEDYGNDVTGGNGVKPAKGYHFTGKYTYVIKDHYGKVIGTGETDDPTSIKVTGNIEFTPQYAPNKYTIKYDANGGSGTMTDQNFTGKDSSAKSKDNEFTRKGHQFVGFKAKLPDGSYLKDKNGKVLIFKNPDEFIEHLHKIGDGAVITLEAQWKKLPTAIYVDPATGRTIQRTLPFLDENTEPDPPADPTRDGYKFVGWERFEEYDENGDLVNVRYEAKWEKIEETTLEPSEDPGDSSGSTKTRKGVKTGDDTFIMMDIAVLLSAGLAIFLMIRRRRKYNR